MTNHDSLQNARRNIKQLSECRFDHNIFSLSLPPASLKNAWNFKFACLSIALALVAALIQFTRVTWALHGENFNESVTIFRNFHNTTTLDDIVTRHEFIQMKF